MPRSFIESALPTRSEYERSLLLPEAERRALEAAAAERAASVTATARSSSWVTLLSTDDYLRGVLALARSRSRLNVHALGPLKRGQWIRPRPACPMLSAAARALGTSASACLAVARRAATPSIGT